MRNDGAGDEIRTRDIDLGKVALYQLSYSRKLAYTFIVDRSGSHVKLSPNRQEFRALFYSPPVL